jgi:hypothetical protein
VARAKALLKTCAFETAKRVRRCGQDKSHVIAPGERCLTFREQMKEKSYCLACARHILVRGLEQLEALLAQL